jgi:hypothetical protein
MESKSKVTRIVHIALVLVGFFVPTLIALQSALPRSNVALLIAGVGLTIAANAKKTIWGQATPEELSAAMRIWHTICVIAGFATMLLPTVSASLTVGSKAAVFVTVFMGLLGNVKEAVGHS